MAAFSSGKVMVHPAGRLESAVGSFGVFRQC